MRFLTLIVVLLLLVSCAKDPGTMPVTIKTYLEVEAPAMLNVSCDNFSLIDTLTDEVEFSCTAERGDVYSLGCTCDDASALIRLRIEVWDEEELMHSTEKEGKTELTYSIIN